LAHSASKHSLGKHENERTKCLSAEKWEQTNYIFKQLPVAKERSISWS